MMLFNDGLRMLRSINLLASSARIFSTQYHLLCHKWSPCQKYCADDRKILRWSRSLYFPLHASQSRLVITKNSENQPYTSRSFYIPYPMISSFSESFGKENESLLKEDSSRHSMIQWFTEIQSYQSSLSHSVIVIQIQQSRNQSSLSHSVIVIQYKVISRHSVTQL